MVGIPEPEELPNGMKYFSYRYERKSGMWRSGVFISFNSTDIFSLKHMGNINEVYVKEITREEFINIVEVGKTKSNWYLEGTDKECQKIVKENGD